MNVRRSIAPTLLVVVSMGCGGGSSPRQPESDFDEIVIGPEGGDFQLSSGIRLSIPRGAVSAKTTLQFRSVQEGDVSMPTEYLRRYEKRYLAGFEARPYGHVFEQPIRVTLPSSGLASSTGLPFPLSLNTRTRPSRLAGGRHPRVAGADARPAALGAEEDSRTRLKTIVVHEDGSMEIPDLAALPEERKAVVLLEVEKLRAACGADLCRCGRIQVTSEDFDSGSSAGGGCYSVYADGYVQFLDCPGEPIETWSLHESNLDVTVVPGSEEIKVGEVVYFSVGLTDEESRPVTDFVIQGIGIEDPAVITQWSVGADSIGIRGLSPGISSAEVVIQAGGCQYKGWLSVEVEEGSIVLSSDRVILPEGEARMVGVRLSDPPPATEEIVVSALVAGDGSIAVASGILMAFDASNWNSHQYLLVAAAEDEDSVNGVATITVMSNVDYYVAETLAAKEIDDDTVNLVTDSERFVTNTDRVFVPEGGSASFLVRLNKEPHATVGVAVLRESGDPDLSVASGSSLVFDDSNWDVYQPVVLSARMDEDADDGAAQIRIAAGLAGIEDRFVAAVEVDVRDASIAIEGSQASYDGRSCWHGVVPVTITADPENPCAGVVRGAGALVYQDSYSYSQYVLDGVRQCHWQEYGTVEVSFQGGRDCSSPPIYSGTARLSKNTTEDTLCSDGSYWTEDNVGEWKSYAVFLESRNDYAETYSGDTDYYRVQLLLPPLDFEARTPR
jgi:hypothetical protein